jgi:hypothetical protein
MRCSRDRFTSWKDGAVEIVIRKPFDGIDDRKPFDGIDENAALARRAPLLASGLRCQRLRGENEDQALISCGSGLARA